MTENGKTILVVEDEKDLREALSAKLTEHGYSVVTASNGETALECAREKKPDILLLDLILPRMDGVTMLELLRKEEWGKGMPVIVLSNIAANEPQTHNLEQLHPLCHLVKSDWPLEDLVNAIHTCVVSGPDAVPTTPPRTE